MMLATRKGKVRGRCPECRTEVWLTAEELGQAFLCNVCGTTFHVRRQRKRRYTPGYWKLKPLPDEVPEEPSRASRDVWPAWLLPLLALLLIALLFLLFGGSPLDDEQPFPRRITR